MSIAEQLDWAGKRQFLTDISDEATELEAQALENMRKNIPSEQLLAGLERMSDELSARYGSFFREQALDGLTSISLQDPDWNLQRVKTIRAEQSTALDRVMHDRMPDVTTRQKLLNVLFAFRTIAWDARFWAERNFSTVDSE